jgi:hypothetical protein
VLAMLASLALCRPCEAQEARPSIDLARFIVQSQMWIEEREAAKRAQTRAEQAGEGAANAPPPTREAPPSSRDPFFYPRPRLSVVARDWDQSLQLYSTAFVIDHVRLTRSTRMMYGRARLEIRPFVPYAQVGLGLWRPDRSAVPLFLADTEYAVQLGAGAELRVARRGALALECAYTMFYRETREPQFIPSPQMVGVIGAMRVEF